MEKQSLFLWGSLLNQLWIGTSARHEKGNTLNWALAHLFPVQPKLAHLCLFFAIFCHLSIFQIWLFYFVDIFLLLTLNFLIASFCILLSSKCYLKTQNWLMSLRLTWLRNISHRNHREIFFSFKYPPQMAWWRFKLVMKRRQKPFSPELIKNSLYILVFNCL